MSELAGQFMEAFDEAVAEATAERHRPVYGTDDDRDFFEFPPEGSLRKLTEAEVQIVLRAVDWTGSLEQAGAWYRTQALPGFGGLTADESGWPCLTDAVRTYLDRIGIGGFA